MRRAVMCAAFLVAMSPFGLADDQENATAASAEKYLGNCPGLSRRLEAHRTRR
jgi:hypothetical protein